jgi:hypothetical protein
MTFEPLGAAAARVVNKIEPGVQTMSQVARKDETSLVPMEPMTPMVMLDRAVASGASVEVMEKLMGLQERWEKNQARKAFDNAMAAAKAEIPVITKNREVDFTSAKGRTNYKHEDLAGIARQVDPILTKHGLSYRYRTSSLPNEPVTVTCIVSHRDGHSEENTLAAGRDETGNKNSIQAVGSTITYLQRYTLKAALGLAAAGDDDGKAANIGQRVTQEQADAIRDLLESEGKSKPAFLKWAKVAKIEDIAADVYDSCVLAIKQPKAG